jgi:hypothetical protein
VTALRLPRATSIARAVAGAAVTALAVSAAQAASVKEVFEKHKLIGTFAIDCSQPASGRNAYYVHRLLNADTLQRDIMDGPTNRAFLVIIDKATESGANEISVSGTRDGKPFTSIYRIEPNRMHVRESTEQGKVLITGGRWAHNNAEFPWAYRCDAPR